jgi:hypothetical protein
VPWPFALEITADDVAPAAGHRLAAISVLAGTLDSARSRAASSKRLDLAEPDGLTGG